MAVLAGKTALITGAARGIGKTFAEALAGAGANVVIADIADGGATARAIAAAHDVVAVAHRTDVSDESAVRALVEGLRERFGGIDILVNNAACFAELPLTPYDEIAVETWDRVMAVNVRGAFLMAKHVGPLMVAAGAGRIVNIGSGTAARGFAGMLPYVTSKAAILGLTRTLSRELGRHGVTVNTLSPGLTETAGAMANPGLAAHAGRGAAARAIPRSAVPADLVGALIFLVSPASGFVTGQTLVVDGGSSNS